MVGRGVKLPPACFIRFYGEFTKENCCCNNDRGAAPITDSLTIQRPGPIVSLFFVTIQAQQCDVLGIYGVPKLLPKPDDDIDFVPIPVPLAMVIEVVIAKEGLPLARYQSYLCSYTYDTGQAS